MDAGTFGRIRDVPLAIVDFDGTLAHLDVDWKTVKERQAEEAVNRGWTWDGSVGMDVNLRRIRRGSDETFRALCAIATVYEIDGFESAAVNEALVEALVGRAGKPTAVFSANTRAALEAILCRPCLSGWTPLLVAKEDVADGKPNPEGLHAVCRHFGIEASACLFIGDTDHDRNAAAAIAMPFVRAQDTWKLESP